MTTHSDNCKGCYSCINPCGRAPSPTLTLEKPAPTNYHCVDCLKSTAHIRKISCYICSICRRVLSDYITKEGTKS